jgi:hypothetical protein
VLLDRQISAGLLFLPPLVLWATGPIGGTQGLTSMLGGGLHGGGSLGCGITAPHGDRTRCSVGIQRLQTQRS